MAEPSRCVHIGDRESDIYELRGDVDYMLRVVVPDIQRYGVVSSKLIKSCEFLDISASFALESIKRTTALPRM